MRYSLIMVLIFILGGIGVVKALGSQPQRPIPPAVFQLQAPHGQATSTGAGFLLVGVRDYRTGELRGVFFDNVYLLLNADGHVMWMQATSFSPPLPPQPINMLKGREYKLIPIKN